MEALVANIFPNITSVQILDNVTRCTAQSSVPDHTYRLTILKVFFCSDIDNNDNYYDDSYTVTCHICHFVDKTNVIRQIQAWYKKKWMVEFVSGVDQENVLLGQHEVQA